MFVIYHWQSTCLAVTLGKNNQTRKRQMSQQQSARQRGFYICLRLRGKNSALYVHLSHTPKNPAALFSFFN